MPENQLPELTSEVLIERFQDPDCEPEQLEASELGAMYWQSDVTFGVKIRLLSETLLRGLR
jgi:hypothetical protein